MESAAAILLVVMVAVCLGYLLPQLVRDKRRLVEAAEQDRSAWGAKAVPRQEPPGPHGPSTQALMPSKVVSPKSMKGRGGMHRPGAGRKAPPSNAARVTTRPAPAPERSIAAGTPVGRGLTARVESNPSQVDRSPLTGRQIPLAVRERRAKAARLRASLTISLAILAVTGWILVITGPLFMVAALVPTVLLGAVLVAGYRTVKLETKADAQRYGGGTPRPVSVRRAGPSRPPATGRSAPPASTVVSAAVPATPGELDAAARYQARQSTRRAREVAAAGASVARVAQVAARARAQRDTTTMEIDGRRIAPAPTVERRNSTPTTAGEAFEGPVESTAAAADQVLPSRGPVIGRPSRLPAPLPITALLADDAEASTSGQAGIRLSQPAASAGIQTERLSAIAPDEPTVALPDQTASTAADATSAGRAWTPVDVPAPAYTLAAISKGWEPAPLTEADFDAARAAAERLAPHTGLTGKIPLPARAIFAESAIDIDTALRRRRASGS